MPYGVYIQSQFIKEDLLNRITSIVSFKIRSNETHCSAFFSFNF